MSSHFTHMLHDPNFNLQITCEMYCLDLKIDYHAVRCQKSGKLSKSGLSGNRTFSFIDAGLLTLLKRERKKYCFILQISILYLFTVNILILISMLSIQKNIGLFLTWIRQELTPMLHDPNFNLQITSEEYCLHLKMDYPVVRGKRPITLTCPDARYKLLLNLRSYIKIS